MENCDRQPTIWRKKMSTYENTFYNPKHSTEKMFTTDALPIEYKGYKIYHRIKGSNKNGDCFDIVKNEKCVGQRAGLNGAKSRIDELAA
jgi:hypothetical protein